MDTTTDCRHILFPYLALSERDFRHLALLIPRTFLLQVLQTPTLPAWATPHFSALPADLDEQQSEQIGRALKNYQEYAAVHQDHCLAASFSSETLSQEGRESRFDIQSSLRSKGSQGPDPETRKLFEAAVFLEMARELDQKETDLESDLAEAANLETEFREILGIGDEDAHDDAIETLAPSLTTTRAHLSFMLPRRMQSWLRLFSGKLSAGKPFTLVTVSQEVVDEVVERVETLTRHRVPKPESIQLPLVSIPCLPKLPADIFSSRLGELLQTDVLQDFWKELEALLSDPENAGRREAMSNAAENLRRAVENSFELPATEYPTMQLSLTGFSGVSLGDLWRALDPGRSTAAEEWDALPAPPLLCLQEQPNADFLFPEDD